MHLLNKKLTAKALPNTVFAKACVPWHVMERDHRPPSRLHVQASQQVALETSVKDRVGFDKPYRVTGDTIKDIQSLYTSLLYEYDYEVQPAWVEGEIPTDLKGTYFRNGPGLQVSSGKYKRHTFDGDGMILSFTFDEGRVRFKNKYVRTKGFLDEQAAGRPVYRTAFTRGAADGNPFFNPFDFTLKNVANTGVLYWAGQLLALYESGLPHALNPATLDTIGETKLGGKLQTSVLNAHYRVVKNADGSHSWVAFSANSGLGGFDMVFYEFAEDGSLQHTPVRTPLPNTTLAMVHDIAVTADYYVVVIGPVEFSPSKFVTQYITSRCSIAECLVYDGSKPSKVYLIPRPGGAAAGSPILPLEAPPMFTFHHANAYQTLGPEGQHLLVLDTASWDEISFDANQHNLSPKYYQGGQRTQLKRLVFDLTQAAAAVGSSNGNGAAASNGSGNGNRSQHNNALLVCQRLVRRTMEFPSVNWDVHGSPHHHIYGCCDIVDHDSYWGPAQAVMKVSVDPAVGISATVSQDDDVAVDVWSPGQRYIVNEPLFVPRPGATAEDDGWVLVTLHNASTLKGDLAILDAQNISKGPVAVIHCPHFLPAGLHGSFCSQLFNSSKGGNEPKWREPNVVKGL